MPFRRVSFINAGYCTQLGYLAGRAAWGSTPFYGVFVYLEHDAHGPALIDTGYSPYFCDATRSFPAPLYRWTTPVHLDPCGDAGEILRRRGVAPEVISHVFISHFHGDHIAGLKHFPSARFVYRRAAYESLMHEPTWRQVRHAFLAELLPQDFAARGLPLEESVFRLESGALDGFRVVDYWGDGDLLLVDLPGHAIGHTGFLIRGPEGYVFYIVDACWDMPAMTAGRQLPMLSRAVQWDYPAYLSTQRRLRDLATKFGFAMLACHCLQTQAHVS